MHITQYIAQILAIVVTLVRCTQEQQIFMHCVKTNLIMMARYKEKFLKYSALVVNYDTNINKYIAAYITQCNPIIEYNNDPKNTNKQKITIEPMQYQDNTTLCYKINILLDDAKTMLECIFYSIKEVMLHDLAQYKACYGYQFNNSVDQSELELQTAILKEQISDALQSFAMPTDLSFFTFLPDSFAHHLQAHLTKKNASNTY